MKKLSLTLAILFIASTVYSNQYSVDENGNVSYKKSTSFNMCACIKESRKFYPNKRVDVLQKMCHDAFVEYLMDVSKKKNKIVVGKYYECSNYKGE